MVPVLACVVFFWTLYANDRLNGIKDVTDVVIYSALLRTGLLQSYYFLYAMAFLVMQVVVLNVYVVN